MKNVLILHAKGASPGHYWYPWLKNNLEEKGIRVNIPELPNDENAKLEDWINFVLEDVDIDSDTILIGHSAGGPLILSILERVKQKVRQAVIVSGFISNGPMLQDSYNWGEIKNNCNDFIFINSDNDPWGCDDKQGRTMLDNIGGTLIIRKGEGHMGSEKFNQPYKEFPFLLRLIAD